MLEIDRISVCYDKAQILRDVSLRVDSGEVVSLIGGNGAGKTTLLRTISGLLRPASGSVRFLGQPIHHLPPYAILQLGISHIPEGREVFEEMTVGENLDLGAFVLRNEEIIRKKLREVFQLFPLLEERKKQLAGSLSGGERQMLAIARGLMSNPRMLLLDEPTLGLAPVLFSTIADVVKQLHNQGNTILLVEENAHLALSLSDRAYVLETGAVVLEGPADQLMEREEIAKAYLGM
jgi:branched-chain amino acid transport system ATP-binding protein